MAELLLPASGPDSLKIAIAYGADAVYLGGEQYGLRAKAKNFSLKEMEEGIRFAHQHDAKVYVTTNVIARNEDLTGLRAYFEKLVAIGADACIVADPGVFRILKQTIPDMEIHISTQANNTNYETFCFWYEQGVKRVVCARELSLTEIQKIRSHIPKDMEIEAFVHGAMCISYSGRCLLSSFMTNRDANRGLCTHPCRWEYALVEKTRPNEPFTIGEDAWGSFILNSKDLCMIDHLPDMLQAGIDSLKIEGRMKSALYTATMARAYKTALSLSLTNPVLYEENKDQLYRAVCDCTHRPYSTGFFYGNPMEEGMIYDESTYVKEYTYLGFVESVDENGYLVLTQKNKFSVGETIEILGKNGDNIPCVVKDIRDEKGRAMESAPHASQKIYIDLGQEVDAYTVLRKETPA